MDNFCFCVFRILRNKVTYFALESWGDIKADIKQLLISLFCAHTSLRTFKFNTISSCMLNMALENQTGVVCQLSLALLCFITSYHLLPKIMCICITDEFSLKNSSLLGLSTPLGCS